MFDWINFHAPTTRKCHKVTINNSVLYIPCEKSKLTQKTTYFDYNDSNIVFVKNETLPFLNWYKNLNGLSIQLLIEGYYSSYDEFICRQVAYRWSSIINTIHNMKITVNFTELGDNILGSAGPTDFIFKNGKWYVTEGIVNLNTKYWNTEKNMLKLNHKCSAYYTLLHEVGHVIGIGTLWLDYQLMSYGPYYVDEKYWNSSYTNALYIGEHGFREYKEYIMKKYDVPESKILGIPVEDDGGPGTKGGHIEEGDSHHKDRYFDGHQHYGLDEELMTGYSEGRSPIPEPLSKITIGMLQDIGYDVDYSKADNF